MRFDAFLWRECVIVPLAPFSCLKKQKTAFHNAVLFCVLAIPKSSKMKTGAKVRLFYELCKFCAQNFVVCKKSSNFAACKILRL